MKCENCLYKNICIITYQNYGTDCDYYVEKANDGTESTGAMTEKNNIATVREQCLDAAKKCVCGDREREYGNPEDNFSKIAMLWNAYLDVDELNAKDVAMMMALLKIARIATGTGTQDSFIDLAGYAACAAEIVERKNSGR